MFGAFRLTNPLSGGLLWYAHPIPNQWRIVSDHPLQRLPKHIAHSTTAKTYIQENPMAPLPAPKVPPTRTPAPRRHHRRDPR
jgi:hypothetical protein